jgi:hypothetical protein
VVVRDTRTALSRTGPVVVVCDMNTGNCVLDTR